jgi:cephalosporin hydroxylase
MIKLDALAIKYQTDKSSLHHNYCDIYEKFFAQMRNDNFVFIEAGIGGYNFIDRGGQSARMWREYFPNAKIVTFDIHEKKLPDFENIEVFKGSQDDYVFLSNIVNNVGAPKVFIDDGSHLSKQQIITFEAIFPLLQSGGIYVVEDIETSWYERDGFGGTENAEDFTAPTAMNYFRKLLNELNSQYIAHYQPDEKYKNKIEAIHFYKNTIIITKL